MVVLTWRLLRHAGSSFGPVFTVFRSVPVSRTHVHEHACMSLSSDQGLGCNCVNLRWCLHLKHWSPRANLRSKAAGKSKALLNHCPSQACTSSICWLRWASGCVRLTQTVFSLVVQQLGKVFEVQELFGPMDKGPGSKAVLCLCWALKQFLPNSGSVHPVSMLLLRACCFRGQGLCGTGLFDATNCCLLCSQWNSVADSSTARCQRGPKACTSWGTERSLPRRLHDSYVQLSNQV